MITEYVPNISMPQKRVKILIPSNSKLSKSTKPKTAQKRVCVVSNKLQKEKCENNAIKKFSNDSMRFLSAFFCEFKISVLQTFYNGIYFEFPWQKTKEWKNWKKAHVHKRNVKEYVLTLQTDAKHSTHYDLLLRFVNHSDLGYWPHSIQGNVFSLNLRNT